MNEGTTRPGAPEAPGVHLHHETTGARRWALAAWLVLLVGVGGSVAGGVLWARSERRGEQRAARAAAGNVTATLTTMLQRDADFVATLRGVLTAEPTLSPTAFDRWYVALGGSERQIGGIGSAVVSLVNQHQLRTFVARRDHDPAYLALVGPNPMPIGSLRAAPYCLLSAGGRLIPLNSLSITLIQENWCASDSTMGSLQAPILDRIAAGAQPYFLALPDLWGNAALVESPFYRQGLPLRTPSQRRSALRGWLMSTFDMQAIVRRAIGQNRGLSVDLLVTNAGTQPALIASSRTRPGPAPELLTTNADIQGHWTIQVRGRLVAAGWAHAHQGWLVFGAGFLVSLLLFTLVLVLSRSRAAALGLVAAKTRELRHLALHDSLTGLPNRVLALDRAEGMLARARREQVPAAALYVDVDGFKHVNDTFGHAVGDEFLRIVAARLEGVIRESDTAARLAGDEFVVLLDASSLDSGPELVAERLLDVLREPYDLKRMVGRQLTLTASIGVAHGLGGTAEQLLADADLALYVAKNGGRNRYVVFESNMQTAAQDRLGLEMDLGEALLEDQLFLVYQPTFDLLTERTVGAEALLRWNHPERGLVGPDQFIPIAERSGLIVPIGRWVLEQACIEAAGWHAAGHTLGISVNVSGRQLDRDDLIEDVAHALQVSGLPPRSLTLEITESTLMQDAEAARERLGELKRLGVRLAIDDFGTGYSSLAYLRQFPVDELKIDRSFVRGIARSRESAALIRTLVRLGKTLHMLTLAEGIEDPLQLRALQRQHCDHGQGFLFARPLDTEDFRAFIDASPLRLVS